MLRSSGGGVIAFVSPAPGVFDWDPQEPPFSDEELTKALSVRRTFADPSLKRKDSCPHPEPCKTVRECLDKIAWYLRYQHQIEASLSEAALVNQ